MEQPLAAVVDYPAVQRLQGLVAQQLNVEAQRRDARGERGLSRDDQQQLALALINSVVAEHVQEMLRAGEQIGTDRSFDERLAGAVYAAMFGAGELQELLDDSRVENININGCDEVWVSYAGHRDPVRHRPLAATDEDLVAIVQSQAAHAGHNARPWTPATPELDLRLSDGSRLSALMVAGERPSISIRKNRFPQIFLPQLVELGTIDAQLAQFLHAAVLARMNIMVCGATDSGKTTLLRALINVIPAWERLILVERALELGLRRHLQLHPNVVEWEVVLPDSEGRGGLSMRSLVQRSLRQDPDRVLVGEVLGEEVVVMLNAMSQGNDGSLSTIHARSSDDAFDRIASYAAVHEQMPFEVAHSLIAGAIDFVVFIRKNPQTGGLRTVAEVREVRSFDRAGGFVASHLVFAPDTTGRATRTEFAISEHRLTRLDGVGYVDDGWFGAA